MAVSKKDRDVWDKLAVVASLMVPLSVAAVGFMGTQYLHRQQEAETKGRLYIQLQTSREKADSDLRKSMFDTVISTFLKPKSRDTAELVLALELLAYNFHEIIDLGPLFKHVETIVRKTEPSSKRLEYGKRLERAAAEVTDKQLAALKDASAIFPDEVSFEELEKHPEGVRLFKRSNVSKNGTGIIPLAQTQNASTFAEVSILSADEKRKELRVLLYVYHVPAAEMAKGEAAQRTEEINLVFRVGFYDFPMIDNTRLANGHRITVVMRSWESDRAEVALAYFPGSRASLKEKPFYDELVQQLQSYNQ